MKIASIKCIMFGAMLFCIQSSLVVSFSVHATAVDFLATPLILRYGDHVDYTGYRGINLTTRLSVGDDENVVELSEDPKSSTKEPVKILNNAPFMSQGEVSKEALNPDFSDPRQTRAVIYTIISLLPVLFLIPLMIGSRDFIPPDALPPVEM